MVQDVAGNTVYKAEYDPFGNVQSETGTNPSDLGYVGTLGYITDSPSDLYVRARYLKPGLGRWLTKDPLWPSESGFVYAEGNPVCWTDPSGRIIYTDCDSSFRNKIDKLCARIKEITPKQQGDINRCVRSTSSASFQECPPFDHRQKRCFQNFCDFGRVKCDPELTAYGVCYLETGDVSINPSPFGGWTFVPKPNWSGRLTLLHEIAHACKIDHGKYGEGSKCQCNDIFACCLFEVLMGRSGDYCSSTMKDFISKGEKCRAPKK